MSKAVPSYTFLVISHIQHMHAFAAHSGLEAAQLIELDECE